MPTQPLKSQIRAWGTSLEAATKFFDGLDIRQYANEVDLFGPYAVEKIQAAIDANETDLLTFPKGIIPINDTVVIWRTMTLRGVRDEMFWREFGDSTGGVQHPEVGTVFWTEGAGVNRIWTSITDADATINPMFVRLGSLICFEDFSIRTGVRTDVVGLSGSAAGWHSAIFDAGSRGHRNRRVTVQGLGNVGFKNARYVDGTNSKFNTALNSLPHYSKIDINLMDVGPTDIKDRECIYAGVKAFTVKGREGTFPAGQNPYGSNGVSDLDIEAHLYNDGPLLDRLDHGALIDIDYKFPSNYSDGSNGGQNMTFTGRHDCSGKWSVKLGHCRKVMIWSDYCETGSNYQSQVAAYNTANGTNFNTRAVVQTDSTCTGAFAIYSKGWFSNIRVDEGSDAAPYSFNCLPVLGRMMEYDGLGNGERNGLLFKSGGFDNNVIPEFGSPAPFGEIRYVYKDNAKDTYKRTRRRGPAKGEDSYDGLSWFSYEEGMWTPVLRGATAPGSNTYTIQSGSWTRSGRLVKVKGVIQINGAVDSVMAGQMQISGLPFTSRNYAGSPAAMSVSDIANANLAPNANLVGYIAPNAAVIALSERLGNDTSLTATSKFGTNFRVRFEAEYEV
jgi:hypothetical protein